ncbi:hypothetical protein NDU88_002508 [Pleurodeles waltl]|uniref:Uncharacterized protein n=1 Tax=Pleurodeles waltl TaxID=8319 RepID=A0AAV7UVT1_PLEWA|nr:hypothetical protein NDU88_002508 [Pleurodeles waltl]
MEWRAGEDRVRLVRPTAWVGRRPRACGERAPQGRGLLASAPSRGGRPSIVGPGRQESRCRGLRRPLGWRPPLDLELGARPTLLRATGDQVRPVKWRPAWGAGGSGPLR